MQGPTPVIVSGAVMRDIPPSLRLVGTVRPAKSATVAAEVAGVIGSFDAYEGQFLQQGAVICRVDPEMARLRLAEAQATFASLEATLAELKAGERPEELRRWEGVVGEAEAGLKKWDFERQRVKDLLARGQSSDKEMHDAEMEYAAATGRAAQARAQLDRAKNGARAEELARAQQNVAAQRAVVERLQRDVRKTEVRAPFDGAVIAQHTEVGEWIDAGGPVCEMVAIETVKIRVDVPEGAVQFARAGAPASVEIEALVESHTTSIARVIPQATPAARTFPVEVDLPNADHKLLPGMFVWVHVPSGPVGQRLMVTKDAIVAHGTNKQIYVVRPGEGGAHMALPLPVTTGLEIVGEVEVQAEGLKPGDSVVSRGNERLSGPTPVIPQPSPAPAEEAGRSAASQPAQASATGGTPADTKP